VTAVLPAVEPAYDPKLLAAVVMLHLAREGVPVVVGSTERIFEDCGRLLRHLGVEAEDDAEVLAEVIPLQRRPVSAVSDAS
jgi:hypothetical protein